LTNAIAGALIAVFVYRWGGLRSALAVSFTTPVWVYAASGFTEPVSALALLLALRWPIALGVSVLVKLPHAVLLPVARRAWPFVLLALAMHAALNYVHFGS